MAVEPRLTRLYVRRYKPAVRTRSRYTLLCLLLGVILGWLPRLVHGPIPEKFNVLYINGAVAVWAYYTARMLIGFVVGITVWPQRWYVRGPMCGFMMLFPLTLISLAKPTCGAPCMCWNLTTASIVGTLVAGVAYVVTGQHHL